MLLAAASCAVGAPAAQAQQWRHVGAADEGEFDVDQESIRRTGYRVRFSLRTRWNELQENSVSHVQYDSIAALMDADCRRWTYRHVSGGTVRRGDELVAQANLTGRSHRAEAGSGFDLVLRGVCRGEWP
jgi:hypothetical protein